jgi:hypothetical protein
MPKVEIEKIIHVPIDKAVEYFGDYELYSSMHAQDDTTYTAVSRRDNEVLVDIKQKIGGREINYTSKTVYHLPQRIETETLSGIGKGSWQKVTFQSVPEGTRVTYASDVKLQFGGMAGKALGMVSGKMMKKMARESLEEGAEVDRKHLEGEQPQTSVTE